MEHQEIPDDDARLLAQLLDLGSDESGLWHADELADIFRHQLASPVEFPFVDAAGLSAAPIRTLCATADPAIASFGELFQHPRPPVPLLRCTKDYAKVCRTLGESPIPAEIATMLYVLSIVAALTSLGERISELNDPAIARIVAWAQDQIWIDDDTRRRLNNARSRLVAEDPNG